eukprot:SAG11_NODE_28629_length_319_cov_1.331818_1_plen_85_part_01
MTRLFHSSVIHFRSNLPQYHCEFDARLTVSSMPTNRTPVTKASPPVYKRKYLLGYSLLLLIPLPPIPRITDCYPSLHNATQTCAV